MSLPEPGISHGDRDGLPGADHNDEAPSSAQGRVQEISLKHDVVRRVQRTDDSRILTPLALMDRDGVGQVELIEFAPCVEGCIIRSVRARVCIGTYRTFRAPGIKIRSPARILAGLEIRLTRLSFFIFTL